MYTVHDEYDLKHSRIAIVFQILFLAVIASVLFIFMNAWFFILSLVAMLLVLYRFHQHPKLKKIAQLDQMQWSLQFQDRAKIKTVKLDKIIEHYFYVVLYYENNSEQKKRQSVLIWKDQVSETAWKKLLIHANM